MDAREDPAGRGAGSAPALTARGLVRRSDGRLPDRRRERRNEGSRECLSRRSARSRSEMGSASRWPVIEHMGSDRPAGEHGYRRRARRDLCRRAAAREECRCAFAHAARPGRHTVGHEAVQQHPCARDPPEAPDEYRWQQGRGLALEAPPQASRVRLVLGAAVRATLKVRERACGKLLACRLAALESMDRRGAKPA